ncbi:MAG: twin-arginine translocase subunit TatC [Armatimonadetes bacterium]|nr:twin-arginine translocase subunit TatC [Armatimonadota bacterium]
MNEKQISFVEHLEELRHRLLVSAAAWLVTSGVAFYFKDQILALLVEPIALTGKKLVFLTPAEAFMNMVIISVIVGFFAALPVILYQVLLFVLPGLTSRERRGVLLLLPFALALFVIGVLFAHQAILPTGLRFLLGYETPNLQAMISISRYVSFVLTLMGACGLIFEMPLVVLTLATMKIISSRFLARKRKYAVLVILITAGIATPSPDIFSQLLLAVPMYILYEISILLARVIARN